MRYLKYLMLCSMWLVYGAAATESHCADDLDPLWANMQHVLESQYQKFLWPEGSEVHTLFQHVMSQKKRSDAIVEDYACLMYLNAPICLERVLVQEQWHTVGALAGCITFSLEAPPKGMVVIKSGGKCLLRAHMTYTQDRVWQETLKTIEEKQYPAVRVLGLLTQSRSEATIVWEPEAPSCWNMGCLFLAKDHLLQAKHICDDAGCANIRFAPVYQKCDGDMVQSNPRTFWRKQRFSFVRAERYHTIDWGRVLKDCRALTRQTPALSAVLDALPLNPTPGHFLHALLSVLPNWKRAGEPLSAYWLCTVKVEGNGGPYSYRVTIHDGRKVHALIQMWSTDRGEGVADYFLSQNTDLPYGALVFMLRAHQHPYLQKIFPLDRQACAGLAGLYKPPHTICSTSVPRGLDRTVRDRALALWTQISDLNMLPEPVPGAVVFFHVDGDHLFFAKPAILDHITRECASASHT